MKRRALEIWGFQDTTQQLEIIIIASSIVVAIFIIIIIIIIIVLFLLLMNSFHFLFHYPNITPVNYTSFPFLFHHPNLTPIYSFLEPDCMSSLAPRAQRTCP